MEDEDNGAGWLKYARQLERELSEANRQSNMLQRYLNEAAQARNEWRDIAKRLAETGGGLGVYSALQYSAAIDEYKRMAAMPNVEPSHREL